MGKSTIERAFELARSGDCKTLEQIRKALTREGFEGVHGHLTGIGLRKQLTDAMSVASGLPALSKPQD